MGTPTLLDSNIAIYLAKGGLPEDVRNRLSKLTQDGFNLSVVTKIELLGYRFPDRKEEVVTRDLVETSQVFGLTDAVAEQTIDIRRKHKIKLPDAVIAATALTYGLTLITRNTSDFAGIDGLSVVNPFG